MYSLLSARMSICCNRCTEALTVTASFTTTSITQAMQVVWVSVNLEDWNKLILVTRIGQKFQRRKIQINFTHWEKLQYQNTSLGLGWGSMSWFLYYLMLTNELKRNILVILKFCWVNPRKSRKWCIVRQKLTIKGEIRSEEIQKLWIINDKGFSIIFINAACMEYF